VNGLLEIPDIPISFMVLKNSENEDLQAALGPNLIYLLINVPYPHPGILG
jgi:hypothetical protein